ncbi:9317_t:CDS:2, partial [Racocetra fulgida]
MGDNKPSDEIRPDNNASSEGTNKKTSNDEEMGDINSKSPESSDEGSEISNEQIFNVVQEEIETILLNELLYMRFQQMIKEGIQKEIRAFISEEREYLNEKKQSEISEKVYNEMSKEISDIFKSKICDKIKNILEESFNAKRPKITTESLDKMLDTIPIITQKMTNKIAKENAAVIISLISTKLKALQSSNISEHPLNESEKNDLHRTLKDIFNKYANEKMNTTALSMYILFVIADSDSLIILDDLTEVFLYDKNKLKLRLALIRTSIDIFIKSIPLITIM